MFYFFYNSLRPNTASGNRFLAFLKGFDELGVETTAVLLTTSCGYLVNESFRHVKVKYLWKEWPLFGHVLRRLHAPFAMRQFVSQLKSGDIVFCYGSPEYLSSFVGINGVKVYHERTESPEVLPLSPPKKQTAYLEACKKLNGLFVISTALKQYFREVGVPVEKIRIVNMTVDCERFVGLSKNKNVWKYIAYCGRIENNKDGVDELIKAFALVCEKHDDIKLYIIGQTPVVTENEENIKLITSLGIRDKVVLTGVVDSSKMPQMLKDATILALDRPNNLQAQNGFPTKLGEYLLSENPVVVTKVGDIPLFLKDGESALLAEECNPQDFSSKLCWLIEHPTEAKQIGQNGKDVAFQYFNYKTETKKIVNFIFGVVQ